MREYLQSFFEEFDYPTEAVNELLCAYDTVMEKNGKAFSKQIEKYNRNYEINLWKYLCDCVKIAQRSGVHSYKMQLLCYICLSKQLKELYVQKGLPLSIYHDSMLDLKYKLFECKAVYDIWGSFVGFWFDAFFNLTRFSLGRLQYQVSKLEKGYQSFPKGTTVLDIHIPRDGTPMDEASVSASIEKAVDFFKGKYKSPLLFQCHSWLLYPQNREIVPKTSNIIKFMDRFDIAESGISQNREDLWRLFDTMEQRPDKLPTDSSLRRAYVEHLKQGKEVGWGLGYFMINC